MRSKSHFGDKFRSVLGLPPKSREPSPGPSISPAGSAVDTSIPSVIIPGAPREPPPTSVTAAETSDRAPPPRPSRSSVSSSHHLFAASQDTTLTPTHATSSLAPPPSVTIVCEPPATGTAASVVLDTAGPPETEETPPSLWQKALRSLEKMPEHKVLSETGVDEDVRQIATAIGDITARIKKEREGKEWKISFGGDKIVMKDIAMKVLHWVHKFREIGDIIIQFDPVHAALPWAGFRLLLKVNMCYKPPAITTGKLTMVFKDLCGQGRCTGRHLDWT